MDEKSLGIKIGASLRSSNERASLAIVALARAELLDDATIAEHTALFVAWDENWRGKRGDIVRDGDGDGLYRSIHDVTNAGQNTKPSQTSSMWTPIGNPEDEWPSWSQPLGGHDAYREGAQTSHRGIRWISEFEGNVWEPGVYGWREA